MLRRLWGGILSALALLAAAAGGVLLWMRYREHKLPAQVRKDIDDARKEVAQLRRERDAAAERAEGHEARAAEIDREIMAHETRAREVLERGTPLTEQEVYDALERILK